MEQQDTEQKTNQYCCDQMETIKQIIFGLNKENISQCVDSINNKIDKTYPISFNLIISQMIYIIFRIKMNDINVYLDFINEIYKFETKNNYKSKIIDVFTHYLLDKDSQESNYILNNMYENDLLEQEITRTQNSAHSARCINDCELHKQLLKEGHNPNELATTIRNDEIEKLQEISSQSNFNFNQTIEPSLYEICSFINQSNISLIDYAAFFSAVKCFKFLLMNEAKVTNTGKYAIAGGNEEIIHLCEQNHSSFEDAYETAIEFHRNDIFHYLYDNKIKENDNLKALGKKCILYHNYEILSFLEKEGMTIDDDIILEASKNGNLFLIIHFLKGSQPSKSLLFNSINTGNSELIQFILDKGIDVNSLDISL